MVSRRTSSRLLLAFALLVGFLAMTDGSDTGIYLVLSPEGANRLLGGVIINIFNEIRNIPLDKIKPKPLHLFGVDEWETQFTSDNYSLADVVPEETGNQMKFVKENGFLFTMNDVRADIMFDYDITAPYVTYPGKTDINFSEMTIEVGLQLTEDALVLKTFELIENPGKMLWVMSTPLLEDFLNLVASDMEHFIKKPTLEKMDAEIEALLQEKLSKWPKAIRIEPTLFMDVAWPSAATIDDNGFMHLNINGGFFTPKGKFSPKSPLTTPKVTVQPKEDFQAYISSFTIESFFEATATDAPLDLPLRELVLKGKTITVGDVLFDSLFPTVEPKEWPKVYPKESVVWISTTNLGCTDVTIKIDETDYITAELAMMLSIWVQKPGSSPEEAVTVKLPMTLSKLSLSASKSTISFDLQGDLAFSSAFTQEYKANDDLALDLEKMQKSWDLLSTTLLRPLIKTYVSDIKKTAEGVTFSEVTYQTDFVVIEGAYSSSQKSEAYSLTSNEQQLRLSSESSGSSVSHTPLYEDF